MAIFAIALISTVLAFVTFFAGLKRIGPTTASTISTFEPIVAVVLAAIVLGETISPLQAVGGLFILAAVIILARSERWRKKDRRKLPKSERKVHDYKADDDKGNNHDKQAATVALTNSI